MKTIEEGAKDWLNIYSSCKTTEIDIFKAGIEFAQRWVRVEKETPLAYENGEWDGKRSDFVFVKVINKNVKYYDVARIYEGKLDGSIFKAWYDNNDFEVEGVVEWRPINIK